MTPRERIKNAMHFKKVDAIPWVELFYEETTLKWFQQGLPADKITVVDWMMNDGYGSFILNWPIVKGFDVNSYFGCGNLGTCPVPVDVGPIPRFKQRKIGEDSKYQEYIMETGARAKRFKSGEYIWYAMPMYTQFPVQDKKSWEEYKKRLDPEDRRRYPKDWEKDAYLKIFEEHQDGNTLISTTGFYGFGAQLMGIVNFNLALYRDPGLIQDMVEYWEYFTIETLRDAVETLKDHIDLVFWWEDLAEKHGPNISPKLYKEYLLPHYKEVTGFFKRNKIDRIMMDSDGNTEPILDLVIEAGITGHWPLEVNAGMDVRTLSKRYGNKLFLAGNLDKREIAKGGEPMRKEIDSKLLVMKETGGYIAGLDHLVPVELTLERFKEYATYLKERLVVE